MAVQPPNINYVQRVFDEYVSCQVPTFTDPNTIFSTYVIFVSITELNCSALAKGFAGEDQLKTLLEKVDRAKIFVYPFVHVVEAAIFVHNASVESVNQLELKDHINKLYSLGLEGFAPLGWREFYQVVCDKLLQLSPASEEQLPTPLVNCDTKALVKASDDKQDEQREVQGNIAKDKEDFTCANKAYLKGDYRKVTELLKDSETFYLVFLCARAFRKLCEFKEAHARFKKAFLLAKNSDQKHSLSHCWARAYLEQYKRDQSPDCLKMCVASLQVSLKHGISLYVAVVALDAFRSAKHEDWENLIKGEHTCHDLMWKCAALLFEYPQYASSAFKLIGNFPVDSVVQLLEKKDCLEFLIVKREVDLYFAILLGWHLLKKKSELWRFLNDQQIKVIYANLRDSARLLLSKGLFYLASLCARDAWGQGHKVGFAVEATILYASALAQMRNFEQLNRWGQTAWNFAEKEHALLVFDLMGAFCHHHRMESQRTIKGSVDPLLTSAVINQEVKERFKRARKLLFYAKFDPYWHSIFKRYGF